MPFLLSASDGAPQRSRQRKCPMGCAGAGSSDVHVSGLRRWSLNWNPTIDPPPRSTTTSAALPPSTNEGRPFIIVCAKAGSAPNMKIRLRRDIGDQCNSSLASIRALTWRHLNLVHRLLEIRQQIAPVLDPHGNPH